MLFLRNPYRTVQEDLPIQYTIPIFLKFERAIVIKVGTVPVPVWVRVVGLTIVMLWHR